MTISFYNVKKRQNIAIPIALIKKIRYGNRFALKAIDDDGINLTKFCKQSDWIALQVKSLN